MKFLIKILNYVGSVDCVKFSHDGRWIASSSDNLIAIWDLVAGKVIHSMEVESSKGGSITSDTNSTLEFHPSEFLLAHTSRLHPLTVFDLHTMEKMYTEENHIINSSERHLKFACGEDDTINVLTVSSDGLVIQDCNDGKLTSIKRFYNKWGDVGDIQIDKSGDIIVASHKNNKMNVWTVGIS